MGDNAGAFAHVDMDSDTFGLELAVEPWFSVFIVFYRALSALVELYRLKFQLQVVHSD